jgi:hypothetical protein
MKVPDGIIIQVRGKKYKSGDECPDNLIPDVVISKSENKSENNQGNTEPKKIEPEKLKSDKKFDFNKKGK